MTVAAGRAAPGPDPDRNRAGTEPATGIRSSDHGSRPTILTALAARIVGLEPSEPVPEEALAIVESAIASRPPALRRQVRLFLGLLRWLPAFRLGSPFERLSVEQQVSVLTWFQSAPVGLFRKGFWGIKALVFMGYYGRPEMGPELGYRPAPAGNEQLHV